MGVDCIECVGFAKYSAKTFFLKFVVIAGEVAADLVPLLFHFVGVAGASGV